MTKLDSNSGYSTPEEDSYYSDDSNEVPPKDVFSFSEVRSCAELARLAEENTLNVKPKYQREFVWSDAEQTKFVDSLMKRMPIPSLCFSVDSQTGKMEAIDGLQRVSTIVRFLSEDSWKLSSIEDIEPKISGKKVFEIKEKNPEMYRHFQNVTIPVTFLRCDLNNKFHSEYIFTIFRRLNAGGQRLKNQEIRNAIFQGSFNSLLKELAELPDWKRFYSNNTGIKKEETNSRYKSEETILRFFAFLDNVSNYNGRLSSFLNEYMRDKRNLDSEQLQVKKRVFLQTINLLKNIDFVDTKKRKRKSNVLVESVMHGVAKNIEHLQQHNAKVEKVIDGLRIIFSSKEFSSEQLSESLYKQQKVKQRLNVAKAAFK